jgi:hypothetical protein
MGKYISIITTMWPWGGAMICLQVTMVAVAEGESGRPHVGFLHCLPEGCGERIPRVLGGLENDYGVSIPEKNRGAR